MEVKKNNNENNPNPAGHLARENFHREQHLCFSPSPFELPEQPCAAWRDCQFIFKLDS